jgi:hypothetical protein
MSLYRQIKTLFTISSLIFTYIIWATASTVILKNNANYMVYIISLCAVFFMQYLREKEKKPVFQLLIPFLSAIVINVIIYNVYSAEYNSLYIFLILIFFNRFENEEINYEVYKYRIKKFIYILIVLGGILSLVNKGLAQNVLRFYLIYLISAIIVLRETRKFASRINDKKSLIVNLAITLSVILLSMDKIYNFLTMVFSYVWLGISFALTEITLGIAYILIYIFRKPLNFIAAFIQRLMLKYLAKKPPEIQNVNNKNIPELLEKDSSNVIVVVFLALLKIIIVIIIVYLMFKAFDTYGKKNSNDEGEVQKEKILREKKNKKNKEGNLSKFMKLFKGKLDVRAQILNVYLKFEQKMSDKGIYKLHMTAGQLSSVAKTQIDDTEAINSITKIYNEAKFSNHEIPEKNVKTAKLNYESLQKKV